MTSPSVEGLATVCDNAADVLLSDLSAPSGGADPAALWEMDRRAIKAEIGSDTPSKWTREVVVTCLSEAAHQVLAIGALLRAGTATASVDPLVRAIIERVGLVNWVLDDRVGPRVRAIRAGLAFTVSLQLYRSAISRLGSEKEIRTRLKAERGALDRSMMKWFHVDRPPSDPDRPTSRPTQDATRWWVEGESYPTLSMLACRGLAHLHLGDDMAAALYEMWSGFSHPSVFFGKVHRGPEDEGVVTFTYRYADLEEAVRYAVLTLLDGIRHWVTYYGMQPQSSLDRIDALTDRLDSLSALWDEHSRH